MKLFIQYSKAISPALASTRRFFRGLPIPLIFLSCFAVPPSGSAEPLYFCSAANLVASGPWSIDIDADGTPDLDVASDGQNVTVLPAAGNSVLAINRSYYTNIPSFTDPVLVGFPDEAASLTNGTIVSFFNPSSPFWRERSDMNDQPITLPMSFSPAAQTVATNYFAVKLRRGQDWVLAWVRVRLTSGAGAACALDWGFDTRSASLLISEISVGQRPLPSTILSMDKVVGIPLFEDAEIDLDADGTADFSFGGEALTTFLGRSVEFGDGTITPPPVVISYWAAADGQNEMLKNNESPCIVQSGAGIADFAPTGSYWAGGSAALVSTSLDTNATWAGPLAQAGDGYMGVRIYKGGDYYYGWIHLQLSSQLNDWGFGPAILGWAVETRPQVPIVAGERGASGQIVLAPPSSAGKQIVVNVSGLSRANVILSSSADLIHWTPLVTNSVPFGFVSPVSALGNQQYFRAKTEN